MTLKKNVLHLPLLHEELKKIKERCGKCGEKLYAQKTKKRKVLTLNGEKILTTRFKYCKTHGASNQALISLVNRICPPGYAFDSKVMIVVGILRWFFNLQRVEIQQLFAARSTKISTGEISNLSEEFLIRFYALHRRHIPRIKALFDKNGGMVLHIDGTGEAGDEIVFTGKDGKTDITLDAQIMPAESVKYLKPFLQNVRDSFGVPLVVVRDMSTQIRDTVSDIFSGVPQQICHYHFVGNLGKLIFKGRYEKLRKLVLDTQVLHQLGALKKKVSKDCLRDDLVSGERKWVALAIEYLLWPREIPSGYPFVLPYFEIMNRVLEISGLIKRIVRWNANHNLAVLAVLDLSKKLKRLTAAHELQMQYYQIKRIYGWFEDTRKDLGVSRHLSGNGQKTKPTDAEEVKERLEKTLARIEIEGREMGGDLHAAAEKIVGEFRGHWDELIVEVKDKFGNPVKIVRHNGMEERGHRWSRMHTRRRTGRSRTTKEMAKYGALLAVLSNLENEVYVKEVLADVKDFVYEMQNISPEAIKEAKKLIRPHQQKLLIRSDKKRAVLLQEFVEILERPENNSDAIFERWFSKLAKSNPKMTP